MSHLAEQKCTTHSLYSRDHPGCQYSILIDELKDDDFKLSIYDSSKANPPKLEKRQAKIIVYIKGGICQDVKTNIPEQLWDYAIVDYDNDPDLPDDHIPFSENEMEPLFL